MSEHRASFPAGCAAPCDDPPSLTRRKGPGNAFPPPPSGPPRPSASSLMTEPADGPHALATGRLTCHGTETREWTQLEGLRLSRSMPDRRPAELYLSSECTSRYIETGLGWLIRKLVRTSRRYQLSKSRRRPGLDGLCPRHHANE